jgi:geranylgeranyl pyrophosphate synthase
VKIWPANQVALLRREIEENLLPLNGITGYCEILRESLSQGNPLKDSEEKQGRPWPLLPLLVCQTVCGQFEQALPAAGAMYFLKTAAEIFDDIEDTDSPASLSARYGPAVATNAASTLLILAEKAILCLQSRGVEDRTVIRVLKAVNSFYTTAGIGQHLDLSVTSGKILSEEKYLEIIHLKSASVIECACQVGALLAAANQETIDKYTQFGYYLGMASQIANDIQGVTSGKDITRRKITLPAIFALAHGNTQVRRQMENFFSHPSEPVNNLEEILQSLFHSGAIQYSLIKTELYKQQALDFLSEVENSGKDANLLKLFLE